MAWDSGIRRDDTVVAIDGRPVTPGDDPAAVERAAAIQVRSASGSLLSASGTSATPVSEQRLVSFLAVAIAFILVGGAVFVLAGDLLAAGAVLCCTLAGAVALLAAIATPMRGALVLGIEWVAIVFSFAGMFLMLLLVPVNRLAARAWRWVAITSLGVHATLAVLYVYAVAAAPSAYPALRWLMVAVLAADALGAVLLVVLAWRNLGTRERQARGALLLIALGTVAGPAPFLLFSLFPYLLGLGYLVQPDIAIVSIVLLPASLGGAVLRGPLLGIERLVRRGLIAVFVWTGLVAVYALGFKEIQQWIDSGQAPLGAMLGSSILGIAVVAGTLPVLQRWLRGRLEGMLFPDVYDYAKTVHEIGREIVLLTGVEAISGYVLAQLGKTLDLCWATIELTTVPGATFYRSGDCPAALDQPHVAPGDAAVNPDQGRRAVQSAAWHVPLVADGVTIGVLKVGPKRHDVELSREDCMLIGTLAPLVGTALQNVLLVRNLESKVATLAEREGALAALSAQLMHVQEQERQRLALDLHDDPLQRAILLARELDAVGGAPPASCWRQSIEEVIVSLRAICAGLRPPVLDDFGLAGGLEWLVNDLRARSDTTFILSIVTADNAPLTRLPADLETALYRVSQEALNNCLKHAQATQVSVTLWQDWERTRLCVIDNGRGLSHPADADRQGLELGFLGMRERLKQWGGVVTVETGPDGGTVVAAEIARGARGARGDGDG